MKHILRLSLLSLLSHLSPLSLSAQWLSSPAPAGGNLEHVFFANDQVGYTTSANGYIYKTTDGGQTWTEKYHPGQLQGFEAFEFNGIFFPSPEVGFFIGIDNSSADYLILRTIDGGDSWIAYTHEFAFTIGACNAIDFPNDATGYVAGDNNRVFKTTDAGATWEVLATPGGANIPVRDVDFVDDQTGFLLYQSNLILKTTNGGDSWQPITTPDFFYSLQFFSTQNGLANGSNGLYQTTNGGLSWGLVDPAHNYEIRSMYFLDRDTGFALSGNDIRKTIDGGQNWYLQEVNLNIPANTNARINEIFCTDVAHGWLCGYQDVGGSSVSMMGQTTNSGGIGLYITVSDSYLDCPGQSSEITPHTIGDPLQINWYANGVLVASSPDPQTFEFQATGVPEILLEATKDDNILRFPISVGVATLPNFSQFSTFSISQQPCAGSPATVNTIWNNPFNADLLIFKDNIFIQKAEISIAPDGTRTFLLPPVYSNTTFELKAGHPCGDIFVAEITVFPRSLPDNSFALLSPQTVFCASIPAGITLKQQDSELNVWYYLFQNGQQVSSKFGTGHPLNFVVYPVEDRTVFSMLASNGCEQFLEDSLVIQIERTDAKFAVSGVNIPQGTPVKVSFQGIPAVAYDWSFGQAAIPAASTLMDPGLVEYTGEVNTQIRLITTGPLGCRDTVVNNIASYSPQDIGEYWAMEMAASNQGNYAGNSVSVDYAGNVILNGVVDSSSSIPSRAGTDFIAKNGSCILKYDRFGVLQWQLNHDIGLTNSQISVDNDGNIIGLYQASGSPKPLYFGTTLGSPRFVNLHSSPVIAKWNSQGKLLWIAEIITCESFRPLGLEIDRQNNIYVLVSGINTFNCNYLLEFLSSDSSSVVRTVHSEVVAKLSPEGIFKTILPLEDAAGQPTINAVSIAIDTSGNIFVGGTSAGPLLAKYNNSGNLLWELSPDTQSPDPYFTSGQITTDTEGNVYMNGQFRWYLRFGNIVLYKPDPDNSSTQFILKTDPSGQVIWATQALSYMQLNSSTDIKVKGDDLFAGLVFFADYNYGPLTIIAQDSSVIGAVWLQLSAQDGSLKTYAAQIEPNPSGELIHYGNYGNSIALDSAGNIHLVGANAYKTWWAGTVLESPKYLYLAKIAGFTGIVDTKEVPADGGSIEVKLSPNPSRKTASLLFEIPENQHLTCQLVKPDGLSTTLFQDRLVSAGELEFFLDPMPAGIYFLVITNELKERKVIKWVVVE